METAIIAMDGFASTGKSTLSKRLAAHMGYTYVDTGYMFRAICWYGIYHQLIKGEVLDVEALEQVLPSLKFSWKKTEDGSSLMAFNGRVHGEELRTVKVSQWVSKMATLGSVRKHLLHQQRQLAAATSVVMDGRDIGTVVFPAAKHKFFLTAHAEVRAQRRFDEMQKKQIPGTYEEVLENVIARDHMDSNRDIAPMKPAEDAIIIDTSDKNLEEVFLLLCSYLR